MVTIRRKPGENPQHGKAVEAVRELIERELEKAAHGKHIIILQITFMSGNVRGHKAPIIYKQVTE